MTRVGNRLALTAGVVTVAGLGAATIAARRQRSSLLMFLIRNALSLQANVFENPAKLREDMQHRSYPKDAAVPASIDRLCHVERWNHDGQEVVRLVPRSRRTDWHIIYLHGGAYIHPLAGFHWNIVEKLVRETGAAVTVPLYALAPENDFRRASDLVATVYDRVSRDDPDAKIVVAGDSAGGNFALNLTLNRRDTGKALPVQLILFSPWVDLALRDPETRTIEDRDTMLAVDGLREAGRWWAGSEDPASPRFSPLYADLKGLPPTMIFQGDHDIFVIDTRNFAQRLAADDVPCQYEEYLGAFHVFVGASMTAEAKRVFRHIGQNMRNCHADNV